MRTFRDVLWVAGSTVRARAVRTALMCVGPLLGVAVIVAAFGVLESAEGDVRASLRELGDDLIVVSAPEGARLPLEAPGRIENVSTVDAAAGIGVVDGAVAHAADPRVGGSAVSNAVYASDPGLATALDVRLRWGRELGEHDLAAGTRAAVIGANVAEALMLEDPALQTIFVNDIAFGVVGVLEPSVVAPEFDNAVLIGRSAAGQLSGQTRAAGYDFIYVRATESVHDTARVLPVAVTYGERRVQPRITLPVDLLRAQVAIDQTLAGALIGLGGLAMAIGGFGIANVMTIAVMERQREIGVRRALGHQRLVIAAQFLTEGAIIGVVGALAGAAAATGVVWLVAQARGWVFIANPPLTAAAVAAGVAVTLLAALYPAVRAARLEPLAALRSD